MMNVLITGPALRDPGGVSGYYNAVLPYLHRQGDFGIHYLEIGSTRGRAGLLNPIADQIRVREAIRKTRPGIFHCNPSLVPKSFFRDGAFIRYAVQRGCPVLVFFRGWDTKFESRAARSFGSFFRLTYGKADHFLVLASAFRDRLHTWGVTAPIEVTTTSVSAKLVENYDGLARFSSNSGLTKILFLSRLERDKGLMETLSATATLCRQGKRVALTIAGAGAAERQVKSLLASQPQLANVVTLVGDVRGERKRALLADHHLFCFPSYYGEGMPNAVLESMALGMAVITTPVGGLADFFEDGKMGCLVQPRSAQSVVDAIGKLMDNPSAMRRMSEYNHAYAAQRFLAPVVAENLLGVYRHVARVEA